MEPKLISTHKGFFPKTGKGAKIERNSYKIYEDSHGRFIEMKDTNNNIFYFDEEDLQTILDLDSGKGNRCSLYVARTGTTNKGRILEYVFYKQNGKTLSLHTLIMNNPPENMSVDHIDNNTLNNRRYNLRYATQSTQNHNRGKRARKINAHPLPDNIKEEELPVFINARYEKGKFDSFIVEKHPLIDLGIEKRKKSSRSMKVSARDKLNQALDILKKFDKKFNDNPEYIKQWKSMKNVE
jgi:hypothetical protein